MKTSVQPFSFVAALAVLLFAGVAHADIVVPEPARDACASKGDGDACELEGKPGTCKKQTCSRKTGGVLNPSFVDEPCVLCSVQQGAKAEPTPAKADPAKPEPAKPDPATPEPAKPDPSTPETAKPEPAKPEPAKAESTKPEPTTQEPTKAEPTKAESTKSCTVATDATPLGSLFVGLALLVLARPRRD